jgi:flagellar motility protein MotE (MotC chaperone)
MRTDFKILEGKTISKVAVYDIGMSQYLYLITNESEMFCLSPISEYDGDVSIEIDAIQKANEKIGATIESLARNQRAWQSKKRTDEENLQKAIDELEHLDIDSELASHDKLQNWNELNTAITALKKEKSTLESALLRADSSVKKAEKDIENLGPSVSSGADGRRWRSPSAGTALHVLSRRRGMRRLVGSL